MKEKFCDRVILGGNGASFGGMNANFYMENRLTYVGDGMPGAGVGGLSEEAKRDMLVDMKARVDAGKKAIEDFLKPKQDLEKLKKELESKATEKEKLYSEISNVLSGQVLLLPDVGASDFESKLKAVVKEAIPDKTVISEDVLKIVSVAAAIEAAKAKEMLIDIFVDDVFVKVGASEGLVGKKSFKVKYENKNIVVELSGKDASAVKAEEAKPAESEAETRAKSQVEAAKKELSGNQSLMTVLGFFGLVKNKEDGNPDLDTAVKDPVVKFVSWLFGAEFAKGAIDPLVKAASAKWPGIGEKIEGWKTELQGVLKSVVPDAQIDEIDGFIKDMPAHVGTWKETGLEKSFKTKKDETVIGGDLIITIPGGKAVTFNQQTPLTVDFVGGGSKTYDAGEKGVKIEGGPDVKIKLVIGSRIPTGSIFDKDVKVWMEKKEEKVTVAEEKTAPAADKAVGKEAPEEKPAT